MNNKYTLEEATIKALQGKLIENYMALSTIVCPKCDNDDQYDGFDFISFDFDEDDYEPYAVTKCKKCNHKFKTLYREYDVDATCPDCGSEGSLGDAEDCLDGRVVTYDAICDNCGANWDVEGSIEILGVKSL